MREAVCFVLIYVFVNTVATMKPKSVNLALETVLQFDKKDHSADVEVLNRVQSFLDSIKTVMAGSNKVVRRTNDNDPKFTDFLLEATEILEKYDDNDLEDFFAVLDDQSRKYNYKGCKFYELVDNNDVRRFMSNTLEQVKDTSAATMRRYLSDIAKAISSDRFDDKHRGIINLVNSLYDGASDKFGKVTKNLRSYKARAKDSVLNLDEIISNGLRTLIFDHYSNLNDNARQQLKTVIRTYWLSNQYNGGNDNTDRNAHDNDDIEVQDYKSKLRVIDVPSKLNKKNHDKLKIKSLKGKSSKKDKKHNTKRITSKINVDFINFKKTTRDQPVFISSEDTKKRKEKQYGVTQGLIDEDLSNSYELKKPKNIEKSYKAIVPTKASSDDESDSGTDSEKISARDSKDEKGISIEFANERYITSHKKKYKKQKIGHVTYDVERRHKFKAHDFTDENGSDKNSETDEKADSSEEVVNSNKPEDEDSGDSDVLVGGQNIHDMRYRTEQRTTKPSEIKWKEVAEELDVATESAKSTKKLRHRQKSQHKSSKKTKEKKKTTAPSVTEEESTTKAIDTKYNKDSAFASSDEGITIETFEDKKEIKDEKKYSNLRKAIKPTTGSVRRLLQNLEKQLEDVKQRMKLVDKVNNTEEDTQTDHKDEKSESQNNNTEEKSQTGAETNVPDEIDKAYEIRTSGDSGASSKTDTEITKTKTSNRDTTTTITVKYEMDSENKPNRTTMQETEARESTRSPIFRSEVVDIDEKSQESKEKDTVIFKTLEDNEITEVNQIYKTSKVEGLNPTTMNTETDKIFKISAEKIDTTLESDNKKTLKENITSTNLPEEEKIKTTVNNREENGNIQMITTIIDLTKHLKDSDTVVVNMEDKEEKKIEEIKEKQESTRNLSDELDLPKPPNFKGGKLDDPFNDLDVNLDFI